MAEAFELAQGYLSLSISTKDMGKQIVKGFGGASVAAKAAGLKSGDSFAKAFSSKSQKADVSSLQEKAAAAAASAAKKVKAAKEAEAKAAAGVRIAEQKLAEVREKDYATYSQHTAAEEKLRQARVKQAVAAEQLESDVEGATKAQKELADANDLVAKKSGLGSKALGGLKKAAKIGAGAAAIGLAAAGTAAVKFGKDSVKSAIGFDDTMRQVGTQTKASGKEMKGLTSLALDMGAKTSFSAQGAADAMLELVKGGMDPATIRAGALNETLTLATAGGLELGDAATYMVQGLNSFGLKGKDAGVVAAALAGGANASTASVEDLGTALGQSSAVAAGFGLSITDTVGGLAALTNNGIKGSDAGTSLKTMLTSLTPSTDKAAKAMKELGLITEDGSNVFFDANGNMKSMTDIAGSLNKATKDLSKEEKQRYLKTIFGSDAQRAANVLATEGAKGLGKYVKATKDKGAAEDLAKSKTKGLSGAMENFQGAIETAQIQFGTYLLPILTKFVKFATAKILPALSKMIDRIGPKIGPAVEKFGKALQFVGKHWKPILLAAGAFVALGASLKALLFISKVKTAMAALGVANTAAAAGTKKLTIAQRIQNIVMKANPIIKIASIILALGAALVVAYKKSETFRKIVDGAFSKVKKAIETVVGWVKENLVPVFKKVVPEVLEKVKKVAGVVFGFFKKNVLPIVKKLGDVFKKVFSGDLKGALTAVGDFYKTVGSKIAGALKKIVPALVKKGAELVGGLVKGLVKSVPKIIDWFKGLPKKISGQSKKIASGLVERGKDMVSGLVKGLAKNLPKVIQWFKDLPKKIGKKVGDLAKWLQENGPKIIEGLVKGLKKALPIIIGVFVGLPALLAAALLGAVAVLVYAAVTLIVEIAKAVGNAIAKKLQPVFTKLTKWFKSTFKKAWDKAKEILLAPVDAARKAIDKVLRAGGKFRKIFDSVRGWISGKFKQGWSKVQGAFTDPVDKARKGLSKTLGSGSKFRKAFDGVRSWMAGKWRKGWAKAEGFLKDPVNSGRDAINNAFKSGSKLRKAFTGVKDWARNTWRKKWSQVRGFLEDPIKNGRETISKAFGYGSKLRKAFTGVKDWARNTWRKKWSTVRGFLEDPVQKGRDTISKAFGYGSKLRNSFNGLKDWARNTWRKKWSNVKEFLADPVGVGKDRIQRAFSREGLRNTFNKFDQFGRKVFGPKWSKMKDVLSKPAKSALTIFQNLFGSGGKVRTLFHRFVDAAKTIFGKVKNALLKPIVAAINAVNKHLIKGGINWLLGKLGVPKEKQMPWIPVPKGFRKGSANTGGKPWEIRGPVHGDEAVIPSRSRRRAEKAVPGGLEHLVRTGEWPVGPLGNARIDQQAKVGPGVPVSLPGLPANLRDIARRGPKQGEESGIGGPVDWANSRVGQMGWYRKCLAFVNAAWNYSVGRFRMATARDSMNAGPRHTGGTPPAGAGVYWDTGWAGHIALADGKGGVFSNDIRQAGRIDHVPQQELNKWGPYRGWWHPQTDQPGKGGGNLLGDIFGFLKGLSPVAFLRKRIGGIAEKITSGGVLAQGLKRIPGYLLEKAKSWISDRVGFGTAGGSAGVSGSNQQIGRALMLRMWNGSQWPALKALWQHESNWNERAYNASSGATGIPQALPGSKMATAGADWRTNAATQIRWGLDYIKSRYGTPSNAWAQWQRRSPHWYASGTLAAAKGPAWVGERGPELVDFKGGERVYTAAESQAMAGSGGDRFEFNGPIGYDPQEVIRVADRMRRNRMIARIGG